MPTTRVDNINHEFEQTGNSGNKYAKTGQKWASSSWQWAGNDEDTTVNVDKPSIKLR